MLPGLYNNTYQFVQTKDEVAIDVEMVHDVRIVRLNATGHLPASVRPWMGDSIGHWEGDTLVVETTNFHPEQVFRGASEHLKVTERFTRVGKDRLHYAFWVEDPTVFAQPWGGEYEFSRITGQVYEYACHEGNYGLVGILQGARDEERTGAQDRAHQHRPEGQGGRSRGRRGLVPHPRIDEAVAGSSGAGIAGLAQDALAGIAAVLGQARRGVVPGLDDQLQAVALRVLGEQQVGEQPKRLRGIALAAVVLVCGGCSRSPGRGCPGPAP